MTDVAERLRAAGLAVKPLEFAPREFQTDMGPYTQTAAQTPFGWVLIQYSEPFRPNTGWAYAFGHDAQIRAFGFRSEEAARAAAQADYESRILAALCGTLERSAHTPPEQGLGPGEAETRRQ